MDQNITSFRSYMRMCAPVSLFVIFAIILAVIGLIYTTYYGNFKTGIMAFLSSAFWIAMVAIILTAVCNIPEKTWKYGELTSWAIVLILLGIQICANTSFTVYTYKNNAETIY